MRIHLRQHLRLLHPPTFLNLIFIYMIWNERTNKILIIRKKVLRLWTQQYSEQYRHAHFLS